MLRWGLFKPVVRESKSWENQTVATRGQLWDLSYQFAIPPTQIVTFRQSGTVLSIGPGSAVTITTGAGWHHSHLNAGDHSLVQIRLQVGGTPEARAGTRVAGSRRLGRRGSH